MIYKYKITQQTITEVTCDTEKQESSSRVISQWAKMTNAPKKAPKTTKVTRVQQSAVTEEVQYEDI